LTIFSSLLQFDHWLFNKINQEWVSPSLDLIIPIFLQEEIWFPLYVFLIVFALYNFRTKGSWWLTALVMTVIISDLISSSLIKSLIFRYRPCQDPVLMDGVRLLANYCPAHSGFPSSPGCNHFAAAWFILITLNETGSWRWLLLLWALIISYGQIYVGVHYPLDVAGGIILGSAIGLGMSRFFKLQFGTLSLK
jgi:undecaprenyl-diphosphatase